MWYSMMRTYDTTASQYETYHREKNPSTTFAEKSAPQKFTEESPRKVRHVAEKSALQKFTEESVPHNK